MSHIARMRCQIRDLESLGEACANKNARLALNQKTFKSYGGGRCEHAITLLDDSQAYEIGVNQSAEVPGTYDLDYDSWGPGAALERRFGPQLVGLQNEYLAVVSEKALRREGFMVQRQEAGEEIRLRAYA